jgi:hypothetical protein
MTQLASSPDFVVRPASDDPHELNYVRKTWLWAHAQGASDFVDAVGGGETYFREHARLRDVAIEHAAVSIAYRPSVPTGICGFAVTGRSERAMGRFMPLVHFVYVKDRWRRLSVAKLLLAPLLHGLTVTEFTHRTEIVEALPVPQGWKFNPYPFLRGET